MTFQSVLFPSTPHLQGQVEKFCGRGNPDNVLVSGWANQHQQRLIITRSCILSDMAPDQFCLTVRTQQQTKIRRGYLAEPMPVQLNWQIVVCSRFHYSIVISPVLLVLYVGQQQAIPLNMLFAVY